MILHSDKYISPNLQNKSSRILRKINKKKKVKDLVCICIASNPNNLFEIIQLNELYKELYENKTYIVVGLANGDEEARILVKDIVQDVFAKQNNVDVRKFFKIK